MAEAFAKCHFGGNGDEFLAIEKGDLLKLTSLNVLMGDSKWYAAYLKGKHGYVAEHMIDIQPHSWFWGGGITQIEAETLLKNQASRKFMIRETPKDSFQFYLSYKLAESVKHFKIFSTSASLNFYFFRDFSGVKMFRSLNALAIYVDNCSWYASPFWIPYEDKEARLQKELTKYCKWVPNL